jgi:hypothetical protein
VKKFPTRTLILMLFTLAAFVWFWVQMHQPRPSMAPVPVAPRLILEPLRVDAGGLQ